MSNRPEIIAAPLEVYLAPVGEAFPDVGVDPTGGWELIGRAGDQNYTDDGVTINLPQTIEEFTPAGSVMPVKGFRTEANVTVGVTLADVRAEILSLARNDNEVTEDGVELTKEVSLLIGSDIAEYALLARGQSPYDNTANGQFQVPRCYMGSDGIEITYTKGEPASVELEFSVLQPDAASEDDFKAIFSNPSE